MKDISSGCAYRILQQGSFLLWVMGIEAREFGISIDGKLSIMPRKNVKIRVTYTP
jgi:hypothetical protein